MMKAENLLDAIGEIDDEIICNARAERQSEAQKWVKWIPAAACLCLAAVVVMIVYNLYIPVSDGAGYVSIRPEQEQQAEQDTSPVYYSDLELAEGSLDEEALSLSESSMMDIKEFDESMLSQDSCCMIIEGTVTNLYVKHYFYDVYDDKFEENGILHGRTDTVVYEIAVDKTWYGTDASGETIFVEDTSYFTEPILSVKQGKRYVLPLYEYGERIWTGVHEYAGGDITRESCYSTIYPYHPQIEVTMDGEYLISQDWITLVEKNAREVIMDTIEAENYNPYKMYLVDGNTFAEQMSVLCNAI